MAYNTYQKRETVADTSTGEITQITETTISHVDNEDDYIKIYKYLNTIFAFKGIPQSLLPVIIEISCFMTFADKGQEVVINKRNKEIICSHLNIKMPRLEQMIRELKKADILRPSGYRGVYSVNPYVVGRGKWTDIKDLRATFDFNKGQFTAIVDAKDKITGESVSRIIQEENARMLNEPKKTINEFIDQFDTLSESIKQFD